MERRDLLKDQIEQAGKVLGKMIAILGGYDGSYITQSTQMRVTDEIADKLQLDLEMLYSLSYDKLKETLTEDQGYNTNTLQLFSKLILALNLENEDNRLRYSMAKRLLQLSIERSEVYSINQHATLNKLEDKINEYGL